DPQAAVEPLLHDDRSAGPGPPVARSWAAAPAGPARAQSRSQEVIPHMTIGCPTIQPIVCSLDSVTNNPRL
ncbi:MAG: hypothetical protein ACXWXA_09805, partial [Candidatus Limnocylindrales bacterium]